MIHSKDDDWFPILSQFYHKSTKINSSISGARLVPTRLAGGGFFNGNLVQGKLLFTLRTLGGVLLCHNQQSAAVWARGGQGKLPGAKVTGRVIRAAVKDTLLTSLAGDDITAVLWTGDTDLLQPGFCVAAVWEIAAADELPVATPTDDQLVTTFRASTPDRFGFGLHLRHELLGAGNGFRKWAIKLAQHGYPTLLAGGDEVQILLHPRRKADVQDIREVFDQEIVDCDTGLGWDQASPFAYDIPALLDRAQGGRIGRRPADAVFFQGAHQGGFGVARRRLGKMLGRDQSQQLLQLPFDKTRWDAHLFFLWRNLIFLPGFFVDNQKALETDRGAGSPEEVLVLGSLSGDFHGKGVVNGCRHLGSQKALPDQLVEAKLVAFKVLVDGFWLADDGGWTDSFVRLLGAARLGAVLGRLSRHEGFPISLGNELACFALGQLGDTGRIGAHVSDQADRAPLSYVNPFVELLSQGHRAPGGVTQATGGVLLQRAGCEGGCRIAPAFAALDLGDGISGAFHIRQQRLHLGFFSKHRLFTVDARQLGDEGLFLTFRLELCFDRPVFFGDKGVDLAFTLDHQAQGDGLDAPGGEPAAHLAPQ